MTIENSWFKEVGLIEWIFLRQRLFKRVFIFILVIFNLVVWGIFLYQLILYIIYTPAHQVMLVELTKERIDFVAYHQQIAAQPLEVANQTAIHLGSGAVGQRYSFVAEVRNVNQIWFIRRVVYHFAWNGGRGQSETSFFLPGETKFLFSLNQVSNTLPTNLKLEIESIAWQRVRPEHVEKLKISKEFTFRVIKFTPSVESEDKIIPATLQFEAKNNSAYNCRSIEVIIVVYQGKTMADVDIVVLKNLERGESRVVDLNLTSPLSFATEIAILPQINILEPDFFMNP